MIVFFTKILAVSHSLSFRLHHKRYRNEMSGKYIAEVHAFMENLNVQKRTM